MKEIKFYIPEDETIPTNLRLYVGNNYVPYERIAGGFRFEVLTKDEEQAMEIVKDIVDTMIREHDDSQHGVSWRTVSLEVVPQTGSFKFGTLIDWKYRVRGSY